VTRQPRIRSRWSRAGLLLALASLLSCAKAPPPPKETAIPLTADLAKAKVRSPTPQHVGLLSFAAAGEKRQVLFMHPPSRVTFPPRVIEPGTKLRFGIAINEAAWDKPGEGALFTVTAVSTKKGTVELFSRYINPKAVAADRRWIDTEISLDGFAKDTVTLTFETDLGLKRDISWAWAGWSTPTLIVPSPD
jgi:hypothetical protein